MVNIIRFIKHLFLPDWRLHLHFKKQQLQQITTAIAESEKVHAGQIRFAVEASLPLRDLLAGRSARERALDVFSQLRIWDTEHNNGVLIYFLLSDNDFEIIVDRGLTAKFDPRVWQAIADSMETHCKSDDYVGAVLVGILTVTQLQARYFSRSGASTNELADEPVILDGH